MELEDWDQPDPDDEPVARQSTEPDPEPTTEQVERPVGATVELDAEGTEVLVVRPDGSKVKVHARHGRAHYVLDQPGRYVVGDLAFRAVPEPGDAP